jgi:dinuclear metal center YbgI/SA1388 family protein
MIPLSDALTVLESIAPLRYAESWDNVGLLVGDPRAEVRRVLVTVDYSDTVAAEARAFSAELVVAYHPPIFAAVKRAPHDALWVDAVRRDVALYSMHTALDVVGEGTNDFLADACGVAKEGRRPLRAFVAKDAREEDVGLGRVGDVVPTTVGALVAQLKATLSLGHVLVAGSLDMPVKRVAVAAGAGGELTNDALRARADVFVTGEIRHHDALLAVRRGMAVIATLHSNSERAAIRAFASRLAPRLRGVEVRASTADADPFVVA